MQGTPVERDRIYLCQLLEAKLEKKGRPDEPKEDGNEVTASREDLLKTRGILIYVKQRGLSGGNWGWMPSECGRLVGSLNFSLVLLLVSLFVRYPDSQGPLLC